MLYFPNNLCGITSDYCKWGYVLSYNTSSNDYSPPRNTITDTNDIVVRYTYLYTFENDAITPYLTVITYFYLGTKTLLPIVVFGAAHILEWSPKYQF